MATTNSDASLMGIPLEIRHIIYEHATARDTKPKKVLRHWFEKREVKELIAKYKTDNPDGIAPRVVYEDIYEDESEPEVDPDEVPVEDDGGDEDDEDDGQGEDDEDDGQGEDDEDDDEENQQDEEAELDNDADDEDGQDTEDPELMDEDAEPDTATNVGGDLDDNMPDGDNGTALPSQGATDNADVDMPDSATDNIGTHASAQSGDEEHQEDQDSGAEEQQLEEEDQDVEDEDENEENMFGGETNPTSVATPSAPIITPHRKWRHIPNFLRITQCPPPTKLLLVSKQINAEAKHWFYKVAVLKINATGSWQHQSFFELALQEIAEAAFSPMESIKKAEVTFVWDSTWVRAEPSGFAASVFPFHLEERANYVVKIMQQAPQLEQVKIHWHDSADDDVSQDLKNQILLPFLDLQARIEVEEHLIASNAKPHSKSLAGKRRLEFQSIFDRGNGTF